MQQWSNYPAAVAKTRQRKPYRPGDDGALRQGMPSPIPRFTDNGNGTVTDNLTQLIWLKNANCAGTVENENSGRTNWENAFAWVEELNQSGTMNGQDAHDTSNGGTHQRDWQLPNVRELQSLIDYGYHEPALCNTAGIAKWQDGDLFDRVQPSYYWSSSTHSKNIANGWFVNLNNGDVLTGHKRDSNNYLWPVRGGQ